LLLVWAIAPMQPIGAQLALIALLAVLAALLCTRAAAMLEGGGDPGAIVLDEIVALPLVFVGVQRLDWLVLLVGFLLFRWFDITKPAWVRAAERLPVGWGIVADDLVAAVSACAVLHGLGWLARTFEWSWFAL
jgi:phosphatidylglycerophosphatase A